MSFGKSTYRDWIVQEDMFVPTYLGMRNSGRPLLNIRAHWTFITPIYWWEYIASKAVCPNAIWEWKSQLFHFTVSRKRKPTRSISYHILPSVSLCGPLSGRMSDQKLDEFPARHVDPTTY
jgi:hypothetical protein